MKTQHWIAFAAAGIGFASASQVQAQSPATDALVSGSRIYQSDCSTCHGSDGRGRTETELGFDNPLPDFTDCDFASREPDGDWTAIIHEGGPIRGFNRIMPAFGDALSDDEIESVVLRLRAFCGDADWPRGDLNLPRALFTEKAYPEDEAVIETSIATEGNDSISHSFIWEQRFGTRNQMEISMPVTRADLGEQGWHSGAGDLAIGVKHTLRHSYENGSILTVGGEMSLATGDETRGFGKGTNVFESYLAYGKLLPEDRFVQLQAITEFPTDSGFEDEFSIRAAIGKTFVKGDGFGRAWTPMIEVLAARELASGADTEWDVVPQFQVSLNKRQHLMASAGLRVPATNRSERDVEFVMYLLWDWFDGGVLEGW